jgi:hypothetical protein
MTDPSPSARRPIGSAARKPLMLAILANRRRRRTALTAEQERLLDDWSAGRLGPDREDAALELVRGNVFAAERVLERRLLALASTSAPPSTRVEAAILKAGTARTGRATVRRPVASLWKWSGIAAATLAVALVTGVVLQEPPSTEATIVELTDLRSLTQAADLQGAPAEKPAFKDVEVPMKVLQRLPRKAASGATLAFPEIAPFIVGPGRDRHHPFRIVVDSALIKEIAANTRQPTLTIRVYDLDDSRLAELRNIVALRSSDKPAYLLTVKPSY